MVRKRSVPPEKSLALLTKQQLILSKERTVLSFMRTGLAFIGVGILVINVFPESHVSVVTGWALVLIGFVEILESYRRLMKYKKKMDGVKKILGEC